MGLFLDTNVLVGYVFDFDYWHEYALIVFSKPYKKYWSIMLKQNLGIKSNLYNMLMIIYLKRLNKC
jgi:hypothetical protein